jgi:hypothetical protein
MMWSFRTLAAGLFLVFSLAGNLTAQDKLYFDTFPLGDVALLEGPFRHARDLNIQTLLHYDVDRLLAPYRKEAGLPEKAKGFRNWEGLDGHVGGHYLSAMAMNYAATGNKECKKRMDYMIAELKACQEANTQKHPEWGTGYVGGVPGSEALWPKIKAGDLAVIWRYWVPWYNVHKMFAGLRDAWLYAGNDEARIMFLKFCDWAIDVTSGLSDEVMERMLDQEHGGMNEVLADAYQMTRDGKYLAAAKRFSHKMLLDAMASGRDNLDNKHANTQVPKAIGFQRVAEVSGDQKYAAAAGFFWESVARNRSLAFGGNSRREFFPAATACDDYVIDVEGPESCNTYNMLKLTEDIFRVNPEAQFAGFYERALFNHILSTQHPHHGGYVYFTPARPRHYRVYSSPNQGMWCCVGSGMENHGKYNQFIFTKHQDSVYVNLFIASELNWRDRKVKIRQETGFPYEDKTRLRITNGSGKFSLMIRYPEWVKAGALKIRVNGNEVPANAGESGYIPVERQWKKGDLVEVDLPMHTWYEPLPNVPDYIALLHGPILLAAKTGTEELSGLIAGDGRWEHIAHGRQLPVDQAPILLANDISSIPGKLEAVPGKPMHFRAPGLKMVNPAEVVFEPFAGVHDARYMIYWMALTEDRYVSYIDSLTKVEQARMELQNRTIDYVAPGEQQPEADHYMEAERSSTGNHWNEFWRDAGNNGYFSYRLSTGGKTGLSLMVRYWGAEWGTRKFDIYIDDKKLITEDNTGRWNQSKFHNLEYPIPDEWVEGKEHIRVKFQSLPGGSAGPVYYIRLLGNVFR